MPRTENKIVRVALELQGDIWQVSVVKSFAPEYGGGSQTFKGNGGPEIHRALEFAARMVTVTPAYNDSPDPEQRYCVVPGISMRYAIRDTTTNKLDRLEYSDYVEAVEAARGLESGSVPFCERKI